MTMAANATMMIVEVYDALIEAGASDDKARKAAAAVASFEHRFARIETDLLVLKWMTGTVLAVTLAVFGLVIKLVT